MSPSALARPVIGRALTARSTTTTTTTTSSHGPIARLARTTTTGLQQQQQQQRTFSTTPELNKRRTRRDNNKQRGLSAMYGNGPRFRMQIRPDEVARPVEGYNPTVETDPDHGLWEFFYNKQTLITPKEMKEHGRAWTVEELRNKSWDDLHKLWWTCVKEMNRIATLKIEHKSMELDLGEDDLKERSAEVRKSMRSIKHALTERYYAWEDARVLAESDPEVDLNSTTNPYVPRDFLEPEETTLVEAEQAQAELEPEIKAESDIKPVDPSTLPAEAGETNQQRPRA